MLARGCAAHPLIRLPQSTAPDDNPGDLIYSTYLGGTGQEYQGGALAVDAAGTRRCRGGTRSSNFPTTPGAFDTELQQWPLEQPSWYG